MEDCGLLPSGKKITPRQATFRNFTLKSTFNHAYRLRHAKSVNGLEEAELLKTCQVIFLAFDGGTFEQLDYAASRVRVLAL